MDSTFHSISVDIWNATWFLIVREILPHEVGIPEEWLRSP
jgi:hypothetical protein